MPLLGQVCIVGIAKNLNVPVIAEGVETESQLNLLKKLGCNIVQGFYFARALHPSDFETNILQKFLTHTQE